MSAYVLTAKERRRIDKEITKYPLAKEASAIMASLAIVQESMGWLSAEQIEAVAEYLSMPPIAAFEIATFYNMYELAPVGKYKLTVCTNLPCALSGANHVVKHLQQKLGIAFGETTPDQKFTLREGECLGACGDAPVLLCNNRKMLSYMSLEQIDAFLAECDE